MDRLSRYPESSNARVAGLFRHLWCLLLCLSLWNGPVPMVHAHESSEEALEQNADLALHVLLCHSLREAGLRNEGLDEELGWHLHLMLWGEIQPDQSNSGNPAPRPQQLQLSEGLALPWSDEGLAADWLDSDDLGWSVTLPVSWFGEALAQDDLERSERVSLSPYQSRIAARRDVTCLLMVVRC